MNAIALAEEAEEITKTDAIVVGTEAEETQSGEVKTLTVTFKNEGNEYDTLKVEEYGKISKPIIDPFKENLNFKGWYDKFGNAFDFDSSTVNEDIELFAMYYANVSLVINGVVGNPIMIDEGEIFSEPTPSPEQAGCDFIAWLTLDDTIYDFSEPVTGDLLLFAQFRKQAAEVKDQNAIFNDYVRTNKLQSADLSLIRNDAQKSEKIFNKTEIKCGCIENVNNNVNNAVTFNLATLENIWFDQNGEFVFFEFICNKCGERTLLFSSNNEATLNGDGSMNSATMMSLTVGKVVTIEYMNTVQFLPGVNGALFNNATVNVLKGTKWDNGWIPDVIPNPTYTHIGWVDESGKPRGVNGPFPDSVEENLVYTAIYINKQKITIVPNNETKVYNGTDQSSDAGYSGGLSGYTIKGDVEIKGTARNVNEPGKLRIVDVSNLTIYKGTEDVTDKFVIDASAEATIKINPAPVIITVYEALKYEGEDDPPFDGKVSELYNEDSIEVEYYRTNLGDEDSEVVGVYEDVLSARYTEVTENYKVTVVPANFTIKEVPKFIVTFKSGDQSNDETKTVTVPRGTPTASIEPNFVGNTGWKFAGWLREENEILTTYGLADTVTEDATYVAQWERIDGMWFTVTYKPGDFGVFEEEVYEKRLKDSTTPQFSKTTQGDYGWKFAGWAREVNGELVYGLAGTVTEDATYVAQWEHIPGYWFKVTYEPGEHGTFPIQEHKDLLKGSRTPKFTGDITGDYGWTFAGWSPTQRNHVTRTVTYTAQWVHTKDMWFTVTYEPGVYGTFEEEGNTDILLGLPTPPFIGTLHDGTATGEDGWVFDGWKPDIADTVTEDATYTAQWKPSMEIEYTVYYYLAGTTEEVAPSNLYTGREMASTVTETAVLIDGYTADAPTKSLTLCATDNEIIFYYTAIPEEEVVVPPVIPPPPVAPPEVIEEEDPIIPVITDPTIIPTEPETETGTPEDDATTPIAPVVVVTPPAVTTNRRVETTPSNTVEVSEEALVSTPPADVEQEQEDNDEDIAINIGDPDVPLAGGLRGTGSWALWNLILSIAGALLALILGLHLLIRKRNDEKDDTEECDVDEEGKKRNRLFFVIATPVLAVIAIILFILTENMRLPMIMTDRWTVAHIILFAVAVISYIFAFRTRRDNDNDDRLAELETID